jgi:hypothetical protein
MLFASTMIYVWGKLYGIREAAAAFDATLSEPMSRDALPAIRTFQRLRSIDTVGTYVDSAATYIGKGRSRAMNAFLRSEADVWVSVDDDCEATLPTLRHAVEACRNSKGICHVPTLKRQPAGLPPCSNTWVRSIAGLVIRPVNRIIQPGDPDGAFALVVPFDHAGFGIVAIHRFACEALVNQYPDLAWDDDDGHCKCAAFFPLFRNRQWFEEDFAFYERLPSRIARECLVTGDSFHDGQHLDLSTFREYLLELEPDEIPATLGRPTVRP